MLLIIDNIELAVRFRHLTREESKQLFSKTLKYFRLSKGFSQNELARKLGILFQQIQKYENGRIRIPDSRLIRICNILGISLDEFLRVAFKDELD